MSAPDFHRVNSHGADFVGNDLLSRLRQWRRRLLGQRLLTVIAAISVLLLAGRLLGSPNSILLQLSLVLTLVGFARLLFSQKWRRLTPENFVQHLNRRFPDFEESAQLLLKDETSLTALQMLQRDRVLAVYQQNLAQLEHWQPEFQYRLNMTVLISCTLLVLFADQLRLLPGRLLPELFLTENPLTAPVSQHPGTSASIESVSIWIEPPAYSGLEPTQSGQLDVELIEGSRLTWVLSFEPQQDNYALQLSDQHRIELNPQADGRLLASAIINKTSLYRIINLTGEAEDSIGNIYSLTVRLDQPPDIRMIEPEVSSLEIPKNEFPGFNSRVLVKDDYGIKTVDILASVAKGSGEAVKFRDQKLSFDHSIETEKGTLFERVWNLEALGMEPGDEVYFTVIATDNRQPQANTGRSATVIVRWLEDEQAGPGAEGLVIDFNPEFFISQRQIIIDTEQLIADKAYLELQAFKDDAYVIGQAQADLKQKYGSYLGDEFGEESGPGMGITHDVAGDKDTDHDQHESEQALEDSSKTNKEINTTADILRLYGHDHGDPEIGPITQYNPVALMKRAVSEMWQAERHLMQAEPEQALPFEYEAYKYLKLARQADRIYVKRLGFEPPPVTEERRLSGELDEILSYRVKQAEHRYDQGSRQWSQLLLIDVYHLLSIHSLLKTLNENQRDQLIGLSRLLTDWSQQSPALIQQAATIEKLLLTGNLQLEDCENCVEELASAVWNLIDDGATQLRRRKAAWLPADELIQSYQQVLEQNESAEAAPADNGGGLQ